MPNKDEARTIVVKSIMDELNYELANIRTQLADEQIYNDPHELEKHVNHLEYMLKQYKKAVDTFKFMNESYAITELLEKHHN